MRSSGILMPVFSLPSKYGIGSFGKAAYDFVDFLVLAGQSYWQILPLGTTMYGDSPYQSYSSAAGNPYFIDLDMLRDDGLLNEEDYVNLDYGDRSKVDYEKIYATRYPLLRKAYGKFKELYGTEKIEKFCADNEWAKDYALFMAIKKHEDSKPWYLWDTLLRMRDADAIKNIKQTLCDEINFQLFMQYEFYCQWDKLKKYANGKGIKIIGDIPIYVAYDSVDVWSNIECFDLDENLTPRSVAGCPPDAFSADGQVWDMPVYNWENIKSAEEPYAFWKRRIGQSLRLYDTVRIDHFRAFESFFVIPYGDKTAKNGKWRKGPDTEIFDVLKSEFGEELPIIAEDLGILTDDVRKLLDYTGFAGMKVLQFAFEPFSESVYLPHNHIKNCVVYTGTHDNDTVIGWVKNGNKEAVKYAEKYLHLDNNEGMNWAMIRAALSSVADTAIIPMADFMGLGSEARINTPATVGDNWNWRIADGCINSWLAGIIRENTALYSRLPK